MGRYASHDRANEIYAVTIVELSREPSICYHAINVGIFLWWIFIEHTELSYSPPVACRNGFPSNAKPWIRSPVMTFVNARSAKKLLYEHDYLTCRSLVVRWLLLRRFCLCTGTSISRKCSSTVAWNAAFFSVGRPMRVKSLCDQRSESMVYFYGKLSILLWREHHDITKKDLQSNAADLLLINSEQLLEISHLVPNIVVSKPLDKD